MGDDLVDEGVGGWWWLCGDDGGSEREGFEICGSKGRRVLRQEEWTSRGRDAG